MALIPIKYHNLNYPNEIIAKIEEVSGHFGKTEISDLLLEKFSLHTEYSAKRRIFSEICINNFPSLVSMNNSKPKLWQSLEWAKDFADFIIQICDDKIPTIIEIHPPNRRRVVLQDFFDMYNIFKEIINEKYPDTTILIENRNGFLLSKVQD